MANMADKNYRSKTLFIRNLSFTTTNEKLSALFEDIGPIKQCFVVKGKDAGCNGLGYVKFSLHEDAEKAKANIHLQFLEGRKLFISYADISRKKTRIKRKVVEAEHDANESIEDEPVDTKDNKPEGKVNSVNRNTKYLQAKIVVFSGFDPQFGIEQVKDFLSDVKNIANIVYPVQERSVNTAFLKFKCVRDAKKARRKIREKVVPGWKLSAELLSTESVQMCQSQKNLKRSRLIVRNLPFLLQEDEFESKFEEFGEVTEINIPTKSNGKKMGFGFVQYSKMSSAERAISNMNGKKFKGRLLAVDWALSKNDFEAVKDKEAVVSEEQDGGNSDSSDDDTGYADSDSDSDAESSLEDDDNNSDDYSDEDISSDENLLKATKNISSKTMKIKRKSDIGEGKTLFIRNVPFNCEEEDLQDLLSDFGSIVYCKVVVDPLTQHSKGTAFVKFSSMEATELCLSKAEDCSKDGGLVLQDRPLKVARAVERESVKDFGKEKPEKVDKRNLFLVREGLVREGTEAAQGLSKVDLTKRAKIEHEMRQKLRNPNIFVSSTRLCIQNLSLDLDDKALRKIMLEAADDKLANITECRVMRDLQRVSCKEGKAIGRSRGFGFVEFKEHQHALNALRSTNNRQENDKHMIVHFSLEDQKKLVARQKNVEKFLSQKAKSKANEKTQSQKQVKPVKQGGKRKVQDGIARTVYTGPKGLPSHSGAKVRHKARKGQGQKGNNKQKKGAKRTASEAFGQHDKVEPVNKKKKDFGKGNVSKHGNSDGFDKLVESYKKKIVSPCPGKWFD